jgi:hypothetical protein
VKQAEDREDRECREDREGREGREDREGRVFSEFCPLRYVSVLSASLCLCSVRFAMSLFSPFSKHKSTGDTFK